MFDRDVYALLGIPDVPGHAFRPRPGGQMALEGGKGSDAPAPDPRLVDAQIKSLGIQDDVIQRMLVMSEDMQPLQKQMLQDSIARSQTLWEQSQDDRQFALGKRAQLAGIQDAIANEAQSFNTEDRRQQLAAQAGADISQSFDMARGQAARERGRMGINPNDGRAMAQQSQMATQEALAQATGRNMAQQQATLERRQLYDRANNALAGYPSMTMGSVGVGSGVAGQSMAMLGAGQANMLQPLQGAGSMAGGMGQNATNMYGTQASVYQNAQNADAAAMGGLGSAIGSAAMAFAL